MKKTTPRTNRLFTILSQILKKNEEEISNIVKQPVNCINKAKRFISKNQNNLEVEHPDLSSCNLPNQINFIGPSCQELGITLDTLMSPTTTRNDSVSMTLPYLNNGSILELDQVRLKQNLTYQQFLDIASHLSCDNSENFDLEQFKYELKKIKSSHDRFLRIEKSKTDQQKYVSFLKSSFSLPKIKENVENISLDKCLVLKKAFQKKKIFLVCELDASAAKISSLQDTVSVMQHCVADENTLRLRKETEIELLNKNL